MGLLEGPDYSSLLCIYPSAEKLQEAQAALYSGLRGTIIPPFMLSLGQLATGLCLRHAGRLVLGAYLRAPLLAHLGDKPMGHAALLADLVAELKAYFPLESPQGIARRLQQPLEGLAPELRERLQEALRLMALYEGFLQREGFMDPADAPAMAAELVRKGVGFSPRLLLVDGLWGLTPSEEVFLREIVGCGAQVLVRLPGGLPEEALAWWLELARASGAEVREGPTRPPHLSYTPYGSEEAEVEALARRLKALGITKGPRALEDVLVLYPGGARYEGLLQRVFRQYGIPYQGPGDEAQRARLQRALLSIPMVLEDDFPLREFATLLSSPWFTAMPQALRDWAPRATLLGIPKGWKAWKDLKEAPARELALLRRRLSPLERVLGRGGFAQVLRAYREVLRRLGFSTPDEFGELLEAHLQGLELLGLAFQRPVGAQRLYDVLRHTLQFIRPEPQGEGLRMVPFERAQALSARMVCFVGLRDGLLPQRAEVDVLLPQSLRAALGLRGLTEHLRAQEVCFNALMAEAQERHLSYAQMEGDRLYLPSVLLADAQPLKPSPGPHGFFSLQEAQIEQGGQKPLPPWEEITVAFRPRRLRVTDIDAFRACPRRFFIEEVLGLEPSRAKPYEPEGKTVGFMVHKVLERAARGQEEGQFRALAMEALQEMFRKLRVEPYWQEYLKEVLQGLLQQLWQMQTELKEKGYRFLEPERPVKGVLEGLPLQGRADRVDAGPDGGLLVLDYKTGDAVLSARDAEQGRVLQPFLYAALLGQEGLRPQRVGLYSLGKGRLYLLPDGRDPQGLESLIQHALRHLGTTAEKLKGGRFEARPREEGLCRACHERPYCPYIHGLRSYAGVH